MRQPLYFLLALALATASPGFAQDGELGVNLSEPLSALAFVNLVETSTGFTKLEKVDGRIVRTSTDARGWPTEDFAFTAMALRNFLGHEVDPNPPVLDLEGVYRGRFTGQADEIRLPVSDSEIIEYDYNESTNTTTFAIDFAMPEQYYGRPYLQLQFLGTRRTPSSPLGSGLTDLRLVRPGYDLNTTQRFNDDWLDAIRPFGVLRYMDWSQTNDNGVFRNEADEVGPIEVDWDDRKEVARQTDATTLRGLKLTEQGLPWRTIIEHANLTGTDAWINVPIHASDNYIRNLARLFARELNPGLKLYVEYSNEVWNFSFPQFDWHYQKTLEEVETNPIYREYGGDGGAAPNFWMAIRFAKRTVEIGQIFQQEGAGTIGNDLLPVMPYYSGGPGNSMGGPFDAVKFMVEFIADYYGPPADYIHAISRTGYFGAGKFNNLPAGASVEEILDAFEDGLIRDHQLYGELADQYGLDFTVYEGTSGHTIDYSGVSPNITNRILAERTERMANLIQRSIVDAFYPNSGDLYMFFATNQFYDRWGFWGFTDIITEPNRDFKYGALLDIINGNPIERVPIVGTSELPLATENVPYTYEIVTYGGNGALQASVSGGLPNGLSISGTTITGTPRETGAFDLNVTVRDADGDTDSRRLTLVVNPVVELPRLASAPTIDGTADNAWSAVPALPLRNSLIGAVPGSSDLSATVKAAWTPAALYFLVDVTDDQLTSDSGDRFQDDAVEVFLDIGNDKASSYGPDDYQIVLRYGDAVDEFLGAGSISGFERADRAKTGGYVMEIAVPWSGAGGSGANGQLVGFDVHVNDDDDGGNRDSKLTYSARVDEAWRNPSIFGTGLLTGGTTDPGPDPEPVDGATVRLRNRATGKYLRPAGPDVDDGLEVADDDGTAAFRWRRVDAGDGYFHFENEATGYYFRPQNANEDSPMLAKPTSWDGTWTQWSLAEATGGAYYIVNRQNGTYIRPTSGSDPAVIQKPTGFSGNWTQWFLEPGGGDGGGGGGGGQVARLQHVNSGKFLYPSDAGANAPLSLGADDGSDAFVWEIALATDGNFLLRNVAYGTYARPDAAVDYAVVETATSSGADAQWVLEPLGDGEVRFLSPVTGGPLTPGSGSNPNAQISPASWSGRWTRWTLEPASGQLRVAAATGEASTLVKLSPNPASDALRVEIAPRDGATPLAGDGPLAFEVADATGRLVLRGLVPRVGPSFVPLESLTPGVFTLRVEGHDPARFVKR